MINSSMRMTFGVLQIKTRKAGAVMSELELTFNQKLIKIQAELKVPKSNTATSEDTISEMQKTF